MWGACGARADGAARIVRTLARELARLPRGTWLTRDLALRLLIVDDAPVLRSLFARIATALGHTVVASESSGLAALERWRELAPDALVVDGRLSATDVVAFIRQARADVPAARVLIVASLEETALVTAALAAGAAAVVLRPLARTQIRDALASLQTPAAAGRPGDGA